MPGGGGGNTLVSLEDIMEDGRLSWEGFDKVRHRPGDPGSQQVRPLRLKGRATDQAGGCVGDGLSVSP